MGGGEGGNLDDNLKKGMASVSRLLLLPRLYRENFPG